MLKKMMSIVAVAGLVLALAVATPARAAVITWGDTQAITTGSPTAGATDVLKSGDTFSVDGGTTTLTAGAGILALNAWGPNPVDDPVVDGITFTDTNLWDPLNETSAVTQVLGGAGTTGDSEYDILIANLDRADVSGFDSATYTLTGLTADTDYVVQVWYVDVRQTTRHMEFAGNNPLTLMAKDWEFGNGIFTADAITQDLTITTNDTGKVHLSAIQVREFAFPEPAVMVWRTDTDFTGDWAGANWSDDGASPWGVPVADKEMVVNSGTAIVSTDVSGTAAGSLEIISLTPATTTATVEITSDGTLAVTGGVNVGDGGTLDVNGVLSVGGLNVDVGGTLELGDGALVVSPLTAETSPVTITVDGTLRGGGGNSELGDPLSGDWYFTNLALSGGVDCFFDYTFTSPAETDVDAGGTMVAIGDSVNIFGAVEMGDGLTIRLIDGLAGGVSADGVDVALFKVIDGAAIDGVAPDVDGLWTPADLAKITILAPDGADYWTWDTLEYVDDEWVVLKGLVTVTPSPTWTATGLGDWNNAANWTTASVPNGNTGAESSVLFGSDITADTTVVTNTPVTVNAITFDSANGYAIAGKGSVTLEDADDAVATVQVAQGTHEFQLPVTLGGNAEVDVVNAGDELIFNNALNLGGFTLEKVGDGLMSVNNVLTLGGGSIEVTEGSLGGSGTVGGSLIVSAAVAPGNSIGTLNVEGDLTLVSASIYEWEVGQGGNADTIHISDGAVDLDNFVLMILDADGYVANASVRLPVFTYDPDTTDVDLTGFANDFANFDATGLDETWMVGDLSLTDDEDGLIYLTGLSGGTLIGAVPGDANGDQIVDAADLTLFDAQLGFRGAGQSCDFDNDGDVDVDDFQIMKDNWGYDGTGGGAPLQLGTETPEPATMTVLAIGGLMVLRRKRRKA